MNLLRSKWLYSGLLLCTVIVAFIAYFKILYAEFVYDDFGFIVNNRSIQSFTPFSKFFANPDIFTGYDSNDLSVGESARNWRPIASLVFAAEYFLFGANPFGFHLISILIHLLNTVLVYLLIKKIASRPILAILASSLWALHPALTEAVSWASNQSSLIFFSFFILSILSILNYAGNYQKKYWLWVSYLFFILSLFSKETALGGIFIIFLISLFYLKNYFRTFTPFVFIGAIYLWLRYNILGEWGDHALRGSFLENLLLAPALFLKYLGLTVWPVNLLLDYSNYPLPAGPGDFRVILGILLFLVFIAIIWLGFKKRQFIFAFGALWFLALILPVLQIIPFQDVAGERFLYAPILGFFILVIFGFEYFLGRIEHRLNFNLPLAGTFLFIVVLSWFFVLTLNRNNDWLNSENLWLSVLRLDAKNKKALQNISAFYLQKGEAEKIIEFSKRLLAIDPENRSGRLHLATGQIISGQYEEAEAGLLDLIKKYPDFEEAKNNLSVLYQQLGRRDSFIDSIIVSPSVEGNVINSGIFGNITLNGRPYEASIDIFSADGVAVISIRSHNDGVFQIPLKPGFYKLKPLDPDGFVAPVHNSYNFTIASGRWLRVKIEYE